MTKPCQVFKQKNNGGRGVPSTKHIKLPSPGQETEKSYDGHKVFLDN